MATVMSLDFVWVFLAAVLIAHGSAFAAPQAVEPLWPGAAPGAMGAEEHDRPTLGVYLPPADKATGTAVVVCPGGGYSGLAMDHEGEAIGQWFNEAGIAAFVVKYRVSPYRHPIPMTDAKRAVRTVRARAGEWGIAPNRVGIMGFSAGGHLAATVATHVDTGDASAEDPIDRQSARPDFAILCYPVISMTAEFMHQGSRRNLLGDEPPEELAAAMSLENSVGPDTPPTFIFHTADDQSVPVENGIAFFQALRKQGISAEMHIFEHGRHGVGLAPDDPALSRWPDLCMNWLRARGLLERP